MDRPVIVNPPDLPEPVGFAHAVIADRTIHLGGQIGEGETLVEQFDSAAGRIVKAMRAAGAEPDDLVSLVVYTTAIDEYRASTTELGEAWRRHFGRRYPAMALVGVVGVDGARRQGRADGRRGAAGWLTSSNRRAGSATSGSRRSRQRASPDAWTGRS